MRRPRPKAGGSGISSAEEEASACHVSEVGLESPEVGGCDGFEVREGDGSEPGLSEDEGDTEGDGEEEEEEEEEEGPDSGGRGADGLLRCSTSAATSHTHTEEAEERDEREQGAERNAEPEAEPQAGPSRAWTGPPQVVATAQTLMEDGEKAERGERERQGAERKAEDAAGGGGRGAASPCTAEVISTKEFISCFWATETNSLVVCGHQKYLHGWIVLVVVE